MADYLQFEVSEGWASRMAAATNPLYAQYNSSHRYHSGEYVYITKKPQFAPEFRPTLCIHVNHNLHPKSGASILSIIIQTYYPSKLRIHIPGSRYELHSPI